MNADNLKLRTMSLRETTAWLYAGLFVIGNLILPQLCHLMPSGGPIWLPIYFFTLIASCCFGWQVGLVTAVVSPLVNSLFFAMPAIGVLPVILIKSVLIAVTAGLLFPRCRYRLLALVLVVLSYQLVGMMFEWFWLGDWRLAVQDVIIGWPGLLVQVFGGYYLIPLFKRLLA